MRQPDIRHDSYGRARNATQRGNMANSTGSHLHHRRDRILGCIEQGQRYPQLVVERLLAGRRGTLSPENGGDQVLGGCLAGGTSYTNHPIWYPGAGKGTQFGEGNGGVADQDGSWSIIGAHSEPCSGPRLSGRVDEIMTITFGLNGYEQVAW